MRFDVISRSPAIQQTDLAIVAVFEQHSPGQAARVLDKDKQLISDSLANGDITGKAGELLLLNRTGELPCKRILLVGCGDRSKFDRAAFRKATQAAFSWLRTRPYNDVISWLAYETVKGADAHRLARITAELWHFGSYNFSRLKSSGDPPAVHIKKLSLGLKNKAAAAAARKGLREGDALGQGMSFMRDLGNLPGNICTPGYLADEARKLARSSKQLSCKVLNEAEMRKLGMGALLAVATGSEQPPHLIVLEYRGAAPSKAPVVLVGKGITFDSGGISIKPPAQMDEMKYDMSGAASVFGTLKAIVELQPRINVVCIIPTCENMPSGRAIKPGDIVTSMSGQTIEILNTDAEGRLILCDALTYARRFKPAAVVDIATLTGACVIALGSQHCGLMSHSDALAKALLDAGTKADDRAWRLPLGDDYAALLKSNFADMANVGGREAGTITAGCFLAKFTADMNWAHLDIAGIAYKSGSEKGSTGRPVPLLLEFVLNYRG